MAGVFGEGAQSRCQVVALGRHVGEEAGRQQGVEYGETDGGHQRIAVVGAALVACLEAAHGLPRQQGREWHAAADALAQGHDVRCDAGLGVGEERAAAAHAGLHFIDDQQYSGFFGELPQGAQEVRRGRHHAAFALHRLQHHRHGGGADAGLHRFEIVQRRPRKAGHLRREKPVPARLAAGRHGGQRAAVKAIVEGDDLVGAALVPLAPFACQLDGALIGLGAAAGEEHPVKAGVRHQPLRQSRRGHVEKGRARVDQLCRLFGQGLLDLRRAMAEAIHRPALHEIQIALAAMVRQPGALAAHEKQIRALGDPHQGISGGGRRLQFMGHGSLRS